MAKVSLAQVMGHETRIPASSSIWCIEPTWRSPFQMYTAAPGSSTLCRVLEDVAARLVRRSDQMGTNRGGSMTVWAGATGSLPASAYAPSVHQRHHTGGQAARGTQNRMPPEVSQTQSWQGKRKVDAWPAWRY
ncbi:MAG: hypothetical protein JXQ75_09535 [Phycisphaerae bacterium]|nr:hypothetical protein [Phycisphaerae bacterium]